VHWRSCSWVARRPNASRGGHRAALRVMCTPLNWNVVAQRAEREQAQAFDLLVASNILAYYDRFQRALAMASNARMMNPGGIFLANDAPSAGRVRLVDLSIVIPSLLQPVGATAETYWRTAGDKKRPPNRGQTGRSLSADSEAAVRPLDRSRRRST
jgi:hypothetical protein